ncbi:MAG: cupredoxin domain-containing protein [Methanotrichaceae archaeon]
MKINKNFLAVGFIVFSACLLSIAAQAQTNNSVLIQDFTFQPNSLTVPVGAAVTWTNRDTVQHEVVSDNGTFDSSILMPNDSFSYTFNQPSNYSYYDKIYPYMFGQIQVTQGQATLKVMDAKSGPDPATGTLSHSQSSMFSQFFHTPSGPAPKTHITNPTNYQIKNLGSTFVYFNNPMYTTSYSMTYFMPSSYQFYSMPYSQYYANYASYSGGTSLWVQGTSGLTQYVTVPLGASLSLIAISPTGGNGYIYETVPGGVSNTNYYYFNQYSQMNFYADTVGQYVLLVSINGRLSNAITINVASYGSSNIMPSYQPPNYSPPSTGYSSSGGY